MTSIMARLSRRNVERIEIVQDVLQNAKVVSIKVIAKKSTISEATELGVLRTFQLAWLVVTRIV